MHQGIYKRIILSYEQPYKTRYNCKSIRIIVKDHYSTQLDICRSLKASRLLYFESYLINLICLDSAT